jgi:glycosyltransferase involved in cell wall biosynthesis
MSLAPRPQIIVAQLGARMHYAVPALLHRAGMLRHFYTDAYVVPGSALDLLGGIVSWLPGKWQPGTLKRLLARREDGIPPDHLTAFNYFGFSYAWALRRARDAAARERVFLAYGRRFGDLVARRDFRGADCLYAFQSAAVPLFQSARQCGMLSILEQFIAPTSLVYHLLSEEHRRWPGWEEPYPGREVWQPRLDLEQVEWDGADRIITPAEFVARGVASQGVPGEKIVVLPYGVDTSRFAVRRRPWDGRGPLRVLFAGGVSLRKGPQYLRQALEKLASGQISARLVGPVTIREPYRRWLGERMELTGQVARQEMLRHYAWADLLVLPSICEGSATVTYEALAAGLPVITTPNAGSVVREGMEGFIVPIRDADAIAARLEKLARDPGLVQEMSHRAWQRAKEFSWEKYGQRLAEFLTSCYQQHRHC